MNKLGLLLCTVSGLASLGLGHLYTQRLESEIAGGPKVPILVAAADIPIAAVLTEKLLAVREVPSAYIESRHVRAADLKKVLGQRVVEGLKANETLMASDMAKFSERKQLSGLVSNGMRAVAIDGRSVGFDGLLRPGDRVDVLLSTGDDGDSGGTTVTLLQNVLVLSVGGTMERGETNEQKTYGRGSSVTVSTNVEQAQILTEAMRRGKLTLTLRNGEDITLVEGISETSAKDLGRASQPARAVSALPAMPAAAGKGEVHRAR